MIANLNFRSNIASPLKVTLLIETLMSGQIAASIAEFPWRKCGQNEIQMMTLKLTRHTIPSVGIGINKILD